MKTQRLKFKNRENHELSAKLEMPVGEKPRVYSVFAHCFTCTKNLTAVTNISRALTQNGIAVLRFDFTGLGDSQGDFSDTNFSSNIEDLIDAAQFLADNYEAPELMIGHSLGGTATLHASLQVESVKAVVTIGSPSDPPHVKKLISSSVDEIAASGEAKVNIGGRPFKIKKQFLDDLEKRDWKEEIKKLKASLLVMHSPQDEIVEVNNAADIFMAAKHPKSFVSLDGSDHLLGEKEISIYTGNVISSWADRYISRTSKSELETEKHVVVRTGPAGYTTEVKAGKHSFLADEPESVGGADLGPTPYGYLLTSLGTCTSMTLRMYADHKKWNLEEVRVHLSHEKVHRDDSEHSADQKAKIDRIEREIELYGDLDETQRERLLEIADRCPVHRTLHGEIEVVTKLKE